MRTVVNIVLAQTMPKLEMTGDYLLAVKRNDQRLSTRNTAWCLQEHNSSTIQITMLTPFIKKVTNNGRTTEGEYRVALPDGRVQVNFSIFFPHIRKFGKSLQF